MKCRFVIFLALGFVAVADAPVLAQPRGGRRGDRAAPDHGWLASLAEGKAQARRTGKPLMVVVRCVP